MREAESLGQFITLSGTPRHSRFTEFEIGTFKVKELYRACCSRNGRMAMHQLGPMLVVDPGDSVAAHCMAGGKMLHWAW